MLTLNSQEYTYVHALYFICFRWNVLRMKTAVQINSAANSDFSANSALMVLDVLVMTSVVAKKFANLEVVKLNQVRIQKKLDILEDVRMEEVHVSAYFTITAEIHARSLAKFYGQYADRHMNLKFV